MGSVVRTGIFLILQIVDLQPRDGKSLVMKAVKWRAGFENQVIKPASWTEDQQCAERALSVFLHLHSNGCAYSECAHFTGEETEMKGFIQGHRAA